MTTMTHDGYVATIELDEEAGLFHGADIARAASADRHRRCPQRQERQHLRRRNVGGVSVGSWRGLLQSSASPAGLAPALENMGVVFRPYPRQAVLSIFFEEGGCHGYGLRERFFCLSSATEL